MPNLDGYRHSLGGVIGPKGENWGTISGKSQVERTQISADVRHAERPEGAKHLASEASAMRWFLRFARFLGRFAPSE